MPDVNKSRPPRTKHSRINAKKIFIGILIIAAVSIVAMAFIPATHWVYGTGYIMTREDAKIQPPLEATLDEWLVDDGAIVKKDQPVIMLSGTVQKAALESAKNELDTARAKLKSLQVSLELQTASLKQQKYRAQRALEQADKDLESMRKAPADVFSPKEFDDARLRRDQAQSLLKELSLPQEEMLAKQINIAKEEVENAEKRVTVRQEELNLRTIRASIGGTIYFNRYDKGQVVTPSNVLGQIFDKTQWVVRLNVQESDLQFVKMEQPVEVEISGFSYLRYGYVTGKICKITPVVSPQATGDGIFPLKAMIDNPTDYRLDAGRSARAWVNVGKVSLLRKILGLY